jgi:Fe2+ or Zn2+ uptake regulation protein
MWKTRVMRNAGELIERFRAEGLKVTPQRELVFRILENNSFHPTAESVYVTAMKTMPTISLKTVYQVLNDLRELGEIQAIEIGGGSLRFDPNVDDHHHLVCRACGLVSDVEIDPGVVGIPRSKRQGFTIDAVEVVFRGMCFDCKQSDQPSIDH